ncbi:MAG: preprotein translocase subunit SecY [candidate division Zixibacteria bacterium]|nr:preprotein translocase subunit SecY [candidate division Zixibacteria bacterium]MBU1471469.1 preprotein translocase subunit SecY [candidate division Zixibacteria bacterium]MBU2625615.1 preprotein translocase subunit SecY [candidate division Zixibacteria bacterium]
MLESFQNAFKIKELRNRIFFTLFILVIYRLGGHIPTPGIDAHALKSFFDSQAASLLGMFDLFVGGAFQKATIFALGIMPYISASIILQLLTPVVPYFQKLQKEGEEGRRKITQYTRYGTVLIAAMQAWGTAIYLQSITLPSGVTAVPNPGFGFLGLTVLTFTSGTIFIMWLGEQITERGIGNGISLIILIGIIARFIPAVIDEVQLMITGVRGIITEAIIVAFLIAVIAAIVLVTRAQRRIPVQYAKRVVGRKMYGGQSTHLPLSVNTAGVIPIIFAQSIMFAPSTLATFFPSNEVVAMIVSYFDPRALTYNIIYAVVIVFFAFFYTAIVINPVELADNMKKQGGFIPGIRPGKRTADYIDRVLTRITLPGAIFFAMIAILPNLLMKYAGVTFYFGGTGILIVVGVALDTLQQMESHLIMRHYDGFMKKGRIRGRSM